MKQSPSTLIFALLFVLVTGSIGMSLHSMMQMAEQWPAPKGQPALRVPAGAAPRLTGTPMPGSATRTHSPNERASS